MQQFLGVELWVGASGVTSGNCLKEMAGTTRLELATSAVTGQRSNQLNYVPAVRNYGEWWAVQDSNLRPPACKAGALTS